MDRKDVVSAEMEQHPGVRVFSFWYEGRRIWVKQAEATRNPRWLRFARCATLALGLGILQPGADPDGKKAICFEAGRLKRLGGRGVRVPEVFAVGDGWFALTDCGENLVSLMDNEDVPLTQKKEMLASAAENLAALHATGLHHGRPALKDMTWDGRAVTLLDFEDGIIVGLSRERRILRDVLIFVQSIFKENGTDGHMLAEGAFATYERLQPHYAACTRSYFGGFHALYFFLRIFLRHTGRDLESVYQTLLFFRK